MFTYSADFFRCHFRHTTWLKHYTYQFAQKLSHITDLSCLFPHSFSRGRRCKRPGPPFQATTLPFGPHLRPPRQRSIPPISPSWWPWLPCPSIPHRQRSTTSLRSDSTRLQIGITLHLLYLDHVFTSAYFNVLDCVCCDVYVNIWLQIISVSDWWCIVSLICLSCDSTVPSQCSSVCRASSTVPSPAHWTQYLLCWTHSRGLPCTLWWV